MENQQRDDDFDALLDKFLSETLSDEDFEDFGDADDEVDEDFLCELMEEPKVASVRMPWRAADADDEKRAYTVSLSLTRGSAKARYTDRAVFVDFETRGDRIPDASRFHCYVFTASCYPMCDTVHGCMVHRSGMELSYEIQCKNVWLPGDYFLLIRDSNEDITRLDFRLDEQLNAVYDTPRYCLPYSMEDMLVSFLHSDGFLRGLARRFGTVELFRKASYYKQMHVYNEFRKEMCGMTIKTMGNLLISTCNNDLTEQALNALSQVRDITAGFRYIDCATLYDAACNNPYEHLHEELEQDGKWVFCLTNLGALLGTGGKVIVKRIASKLRSVPENALWLCGTRQEINTMLEQFPSLQALFSRESWIEQKPYTAMELVHAFFAQLEEHHLTPDEQLKDTVSRAILKGYKDGGLAKWTQGDMRQLVVDEIRPRYLQRALAEILSDNLPLLTLDDIPMEKLTGGISTYEQSIRELEEMVGLEEVKQGIVTMANNTRFYQERRRCGLHTSEDVAHHAIFTGNPGTGKTTVARMLGKIYRSLGLLSKGEVIAVDRTRIVGRYIGETEENMKALLEEARGNVLFIDEAYTLYDGAGDRKDFGNRAIDSLLTVLSQPDPDMLIVFAGYEKQMDAMLSTNPGLVGRFPYKYRFKDYNAEQLMQIACRLFSQDDYILTDAARDLLLKDITQTLRERTANFGNARWIKQFVRNGIIPAMANRVATTASSDYQHVEASDVEKAFERFNPRVIELKPRRPVGFSA